MQWDQTPNAGFSKGLPWIPVHENYKSINVAAAEDDPNSILHFYRKMIAFRKAQPTLIYGDYQDLEPQHSQLFLYRRWDIKEEFLIVHNFSNHAIDWEKPKTQYNLQIGNYANPEEGRLSPWESRVYRLN